MANEDDLLKRYEESTGAAVVVAKSIERHLILACEATARARESTETADREGRLALAAVKRLACGACGKPLTQHGPTGACRSSAAV